jgi:WD40 repeat protein
MPKTLLLSLVLIHVLAGCTNLMEAEPASRVVAGAHDFGTTAIAYTPDGRQLVSGGFRGEVKIWDARTQDLVSTQGTHQDAVRALLPLGAADVVSGGDDGRIVRTRNGRVSAQAQSAPVTALALFQGRLVSGHVDGLLRVWSVDRLQLLQAHPLEREIVALSAHGDHLAVGLPRAVRLLDRRYATRSVLPAASTPHDLQFSPDGRLLAAGGWFSLSVWDVASGAFRTVPSEHNGLLTSIAFSPDGDLLATLGRHTDSAVRVLDTRDFSVARRFQAHDLCGAMIRFSPDGESLASASDDESVRVYTLGRTRYSGRGTSPSAH